MKRLDNLHILYLALVILGISSNSGSFLISQYLISAGLVCEDNPHMAELMASPSVAWLTGLIVLGLAYVFLYMLKPLSMVYKTIIASAGTALTLSNLTHDITVFLPHYTHSIATILPAALTPVITAVIIFEITQNKIKIIQ